MMNRGMSDMIERVARAISAHYVRLSGGDSPIFDELTEGERDDLRAEARAAIEVMREPTEAMCDAGGTEVWDRYEDDYPEGAAAAWRKMIDAALGIIEPEDEADV
jgi:N-methylhydantoinase B/oxoprolinase/acetone carboxylase alpha subunit